MSSKVTVIICTAGKPEVLKNALLSLSSVELPAGFSGEVLIVDNLPSTALEVVENAQVSSFTLRYLPEPRKGKSIGLNSAIATCDSDILVFTDDDLLFQKSWIVELIEPIMSGRADAVAGAIRLAPHLERPWMKQIHRAFFAEMLGPSYGALKLVGANMAFHRRVLSKVPAFDIALGPGALGFSDDSLFSDQLTAAGFRIEYSPNAEISHHFDESRLKRINILKHAAQIGRSQAHVAHHWDHRTILLPGLQAVRKKVQLALWRFRHQQELLIDEGCSEHEIYEVIALNFYDQFHKVRGEPRLYNRPDKVANDTPGLAGRWQRFKNSLSKGSG